MHRSCVAGRAQDSKEMAEDDVAERYESATAVTLGVTVFSTSFLGLFVAAVPASRSLFEFLAATLLWPTCLLWLNWCVLVPLTEQQRHRLKTVRRVKTALGSLGLFLVPICTDAMRRGPGRIIGASESAAAILVTARAMQLLRRLETAESEETPSCPGSPPSQLWGRWRRFYHMACLSWHDVDRVCVLRETEHQRHYTKAFAELIISVLGLAAASMKQSFSL